MSLQYHPDHQDDEQSQNILASINSNRNQIQSPTISPDSIKSNNQKEKSPMCLANELARFNEITHEYQLIEESGPAHQKTFTVVLKLGENEEYRASGPSIRKAQHAAALIALQETKMKHPAPKTSRKTSRSNWPLTPTVELNVLAMKRGEPAMYQVYEPRPTTSQITPFGPVGHGIYDFRGMYNQRYHYPRGPFCATVNVGEKQFVGKGRTAQTAKHAAAEEALKSLRELPLPEHRVGKPLLPEYESEDDSIKSPISLVHEIALKRSMCVKFEVISQSGPSHMPLFLTKCLVGDNFVTEGEGNGKKISKRRAAEKMVEELKKLPPLPVIQKVEDIQGIKAPVRKKPFVKKKRSPVIIKEKIPVNHTCENLEEPAGSLKPHKTDVNDSSLIVLNQSNLQSISSVPTIHPINRLFQIQQARKEKEPQFHVISERNIDKRKKEFIIECSVANTKSVCTINGENSNLITSTGTGGSKKAAKKNAAEAMLQILGYSAPSNNVLCKSSIMDKASFQRSSPPSILKSAVENLDGDLQSSGQKVRKVKFVETTDVKDQVSNQQNLETLGQGKFGRQLAPGLLLMPTSNGTQIISTTKNETICNENDLHLNQSNGLKNTSENEGKTLDLASIIAKELLETGISHTSLSISAKSNHSSDLVANQHVVINRPSLQLLYISSVLNSSAFQIHFSDIPKANKLEYLTVVTITSNPPLVCHGLGPTIDISRDAAALQAIKALILRPGSISGNKTSPSSSNLRMNLNGNTEDSSSINVLLN